MYTKIFTFLRFVIQYFKCIQLYDEHLRYSFDINNWQLRYCGKVLQCNEIFQLYITMMVCNQFVVLSQLCLVTIFTIFVQIDSLCIDKYGNYVNSHLEHIQSKSHFRQKPGKFSRKEECLQVFKGVCFIQENQRNEWAQCISISNHHTQRAKRHECCYV